MSSIEHATRLMEMEYMRQQRRWGGPTHDDQHSPDEWEGILTRLLSEALGEHTKAGQDRLAVQLATTGKAAIESTVRRLLSMQQHGANAATDEGVLLAWATYDVEHDQALVALRLPGKLDTTLSLDQAYQFALTLLGVLANSDANAFIVRFLVQRDNISAQDVIEQLGLYRQSQAQEVVDTQTGEVIDLNDDSPLPTLRLVED